MTKNKADAWFDGGWRDDPEEEITLGKVMLMMAESSRNKATLDPELSHILNRNMMNKQNAALDKVRAERRKMMRKRKPTWVD